VIRNGIRITRHVSRLTLYVTTLDAPTTHQLPNSGCQVPAFFADLGKNGHRLFEWP
jgi:hypothetical protein